MVIVLLWSGVGYDMVIFLAGLQNIPREYYEAAQIDGASGFRQFRDITLPLLTPTTFFLMVIAIIGSLQVFDLVFIMTRVGNTNRFPTIVYYIYRGRVPELPHGLRHHRRLGAPADHPGLYAVAVPAAAALGALRMNSHSLRYTLSAPSVACRRC